MRNMIVAYKGGGYDGCIWEPNFAFFDKNGVLCDVGSSGYAGLFKKGKPQQKDTLEELTKLVLSQEWQDDASAEFFDLTERGVKSMFNSYRGDFCLYVMKEIEELSRGTGHSSGSPGVPCTECGVFHDPEDMMLPEGCGRGDGGIGIIIDDVICQDCYCAGCCRECSSYRGTDQLEEGLCSDCYEKREGDSDD